MGARCRTAASESFGTVNFSDLGNRLAFAALEVLRKNVSPSVAHCGYVAALAESFIRGGLTCAFRRLFR